MTDKSFGDHMNRNIVKNPLLSTAVTGLSLEDLTHNAVLLPVAQSQEVIARSDHQITQNRPLGNADNVPQYQPNDPNANQSQVTYQHNINNTIKTEKLYENVNTTKPVATKSKASDKSNDDFDVNEYFARLQGTRYVSAPINSSLKEDTNANLETEENLEEINLNEPEKSEPQSITADIAQNFSQLPTVLPQVASAVFSSFSSMLSMKSREGTPGEVKSYHEVPLQRSEVSVPLVSVPEVRDMGPPPKELPNIGTTSHYRLPIKKKYAPIPGLSTGDTGQNPIAQSFQPQQNVPAYFVPQSQYDTKIVDNSNNINQNINIETSQVDVKAQETIQAIPNVTAEAVTNPQYNFYNPTNFNTPNIPTDNSNDKPTQFGNVNVTEPVLNMERQDTVPVQTGIIPPPPMFSNVQRRDSQPNVNILPPSVARRIGSSQPVIKPNITPMAYTENIFTPTMSEFAQNDPNTNYQDESKLEPLFGPFGHSVAPTPPMPTSVSVPVAKGQDKWFTPAFPQTETKTPSSSAALNLPPPPKTGQSAAPTSSIFTPAFAKDSTSTMPSVFTPEFPKDSTTTIPSVFTAEFPRDSTSSVPSVFTPEFPSNSTSKIPSVFTPDIPRDSTSAMSSVFTPKLPSNSTSTIPSVFTPEFPKESISTVPSLFTPEIPRDSTTVSPQASEPTPTFFNPGSLNVQPNEPVIQDIQFTKAVEPPKPPVQPPKLTGAVNYRLAKKRPQYYAGPIEGVGAISNNVKPVLEPVQNTAFHGALFTPAQPAAEIVEQNLVNPNIDQASVPFDITKQTEPAYAPFDITQQQTYNPPSYNTAFDVSRNIEYEPPKQESTGFGIIGSLKSKLSSIDINKIQNSVTTFFDPAYNDTVKESTSTQQNVPYSQQNYPTYSQYAQPDSSNFEIFVPNTDQVQTYNKSYGYDYTAQNPVSSLTNQTKWNQHYQTQDSYNYYQNPEQNLTHTQNLYDQNQPDISSTVQQNLGQNVYDPNQAVISATVSNTQDDNSTFNIPPTHIQPETKQSSNTAEDTVVKDSSKDIDAVPLMTSHFNQPLIPTHDIITKPSFGTDATAKSFFDNPLPDPENTVVLEVFHKLENKEDNKNTIEDVKRSIDVRDDVQTSENNFTIQDNETKSVESTFSNFTFEENKAQDFLLHTQKQDATVTKSGTLDVSSVALLGLSNMLAEKSKELTDLESDIQNMTIDAEKTESIFSQASDATFFDNMNLGKATEEHKNDLNICETCREVDKPDDRELDNLTDQLIENIVSPIQLSNPVEVPLTETNTPIQDLDDFNSNQCAEISHITEETIETIQVQSAAELLDEDDLPANTLSYGWSTDTTPFISKVIPDHEYNLNLGLQSSMDHGFTLPNPDTDFGLPTTAIGFFGTESLFMENVPNNASDELKAELKFTHEDSPVVLPRQMSIPSAPPAEDDSKSDETGIDVHSIEQDAKQDFPIFEEFIVEPSSTDDDKLEYREREKSTEDVREVDSFTNRVERFKKMESSEHLEISPFNLGSTASPSLPIASYFDTGNYAAETHYRNSIPSPTNLGSLNLGSSNQIRIPPGFEDEYQRRMSVVSSGQSNDSTRNDFFSAPCIPDCSTQTRTVHSPSFSVAQTRLDPFLGTTVISKMSESVQENKPHSTGLPKFDIAFGSNVQNVEKHIQEPSIFKAAELAQGDVFGKKSQELPNEKTVELAYSLDGTKIKQTSKDDDRFENFGLSFTSLKDVVEKSQKEQGFIGFSGVVDSDAEIPSFFTNPVALASENIDPPGMFGLFSTEENEESISFFKPTIEPSAEAIENPIQSKPEKCVPTMPDPINFFSSPETEQNEDTGFNRLASYFSTPAKTDNAKSFFELSQSQDHYRLTVPTSSKAYGDTAANVQKFFDAQKPDQKPSIHNIDQERYIANLNLMKDLTSVQNLEPSPEQIVRTVNYFTIEYNNLGSLTKEYIGEPEISKTNDLKKDQVVKEKVELDEDVDNVIKNCKYCCDLNVGLVNKLDNIEYECVFGKDYKVKQCMDTPVTEKDNRSTMEIRKETQETASVTVNFGIDQDQEGSSHSVLVNSENRISSEYLPVKHHWFYRVDVEGKSIWRGFSLDDSRALEEAHQSPDLSETTVVPTDGGRFDVNVLGRLRVAVYWNDKPSNVRRCSWFYKGTTDARYVPYSESVAEKLEEEFRRGVTTGEWHRRLVLPNNELVVMHGPSVMVHFLQSHATDVYSGPAQATTRPRGVRRGVDDSEIEDIEPSNIDHLLLLCHGVGSACDMRFRSVEQVVDDFRTTSLQLLQSHYKSSYENGIVGRIEVLPISWHATLHSGETGVDRRLARITLDSIPRLRSFTNDTVLDVLFYTSPVFCQTIVDTVCKELNRVYSLFKLRNPNFSGGVSVGGHSLGSVILYDLLCNQPPTKNTLKTSTNEKKYVNGETCAGQPCVKYPTLDFTPVALYGLGSPIAIFECVRGVDSLGPRFALPTCPHFFNIFHPYDPIAYRIEPLINPELRRVKPFLIPHHKGRKRMHLELKDTMARVGADIKQKLFESIKSTWSSMWRTPPTDTQLERVVEEEIEKERLAGEPPDDHSENTEPIASADMLGALNGGRRVDYVLQEAPLEMINEYLFAMSSHVCYWESEDTMLLMLREIYSALGVQPDCSVPQGSMTVRREHKLDESVVHVTGRASTSHDNV